METPSALPSLDTAGPGTAGRTPWIRSKDSTRKTCSFSGGTPWRAGSPRRRAVPHGVDLDAARAPERPPLPRILGPPVGAMTATRARAPRRARALGHAQRATFMAYWIASPVMVPCASGTRRGWRAPYPRGARRLRQEDALHDSNTGSRRREWRWAYVKLRKAHRELPHSLEFRKGARCVKAVNHEHQIRGPVLHLGPARSGKSSLRLAKPRVPGELQENQSGTMLSRR